MYGHDLPRLCSSLALLSALLCLPAAAESDCSLLVISKPLGAHVLVDNIPKGKTPVRLTGLTRGVHTIILVHDEYARLEKTVNLTPGSNRVLKLELTKEAVATDRPAAEEPATETAKKDEKPPRTIKVDCPACRGSGLIQVTGCARCRGTGYVGHGTCPVCRGTARVKYSCPYCKGTGKDKNGRDCRACRGRGAPPCLICKGTGKIPRLNPDAVGRPTFPCEICAGTGFEVEVKCRICAGTGRVKSPGTTSGNVYMYTSGPCRHCGGDGKGPPICPGCHGRGFSGTPPRHRPCTQCSGTGRALLPCHACGGRGFIIGR